MCMMPDSLDLNPHSAAGLNVAALGEGVEWDDKQFWLGHAISVDVTVSKDASLLPYLRGKIDFISR